jgi:hypothetical protein
MNAELKQWMAIAAVKMNDAITSAVEAHHAFLLERGATEAESDAACLRYVHELEAWKQEKLAELESEIAELLARKRKHLH